MKPAEAAESSPIAPLPAKPAPEDRQARSVIRHQRFGALPAERTAPTDGLRRRLILRLQTIDNRWLRMNWVRLALDRPGQVA